MLNLRFILNEPRNPQNIGVAARGMANFGYRDLSVVAPYEVAWKEIRSAAHAGEVVEKARKFKDLKAALKGVQLVIGTSAGTRRKQDLRWTDLDGMRTLVAEAKKKKQSMAVLFGSETSGLSSEDLSFCHAIVRLPTVPACPSMNLGQAVTLMAYILREETEVRYPKSAKTKTVPVERMERLVSHALLATEAAKLLKGWDLKRSEERLRKSLYQWNLSTVDIAMLHSMFRWMISKKS